MFELMLVVGILAARRLVQRSIALANRAAHWTSWLYTGASGFFPENSLQNFSAKVFFEEIDAVFCGENPK